MERRAAEAGSSVRTATCANGSSASRGSSGWVKATMPDELARWAAGRAPELLARAEAEAVEVLRDALLEAVLPRRQEPRRQPQPVPRPEPVGGDDALWAYCVMRAEDEMSLDTTGV